MARTVEEVIDFKDGIEVFGKKRDTCLGMCLMLCFLFLRLMILKVELKAYLGVKHGSLVDALGIPPSVIAEKMGFVGYKYLRMKEATEKKMYPELISTVDSDLLDTEQEKDIEKPKEGVQNPEKKKKNVKKEKRKKYDNEKGQTHSF
jgi:hypothetical protein